jgi:hypothetical protein
LTLFNYIGGDCVFPACLPWTSCAICTPPHRKKTWSNAELPQRIQGVDEKVDARIRMYRLLSHNHAAMPATFQDAHEQQQGNSPRRRPAVQQQCL